MKRATLALLLFSATLGVVAPRAAGFPEPIPIEGGQITGIPAWGWNVREYRGIPYAAPPLGNLRWKPPQPVVPWQGVRAMKQFGPPCMQQEQPINGGSWNRAVLPFSEDCLTLNVWSPATSPVDRLPVMVWIYGGGGVLGYAGDPRYDASMVARKGVVVVSLNYRVNVFGWLAHPELTQESEHRSSGNYGSLDQLAALKWVKNNIAAFGGDPDKITVWGQSGGARSVNFLVASPLSRGLARAAIAQSHTSFGRMTTLVDAEANGTAFMKAAGRNTLAELRAMSSQEIFEVFRRRSAGLNGAIVDGWFLPTDIYTIYAQGKQNDLVLVTGGTNDEGGNLPSVGGPATGGRGGATVADGGAGEGGGRGGAPSTVAEYRAWAERTVGAKATELLRLYPASTDAQVATAYHDLSRDVNFSGHRTWAKLQVTTGKQPAYVYMFSHVAPVPQGNGNSPPPMRGAVHFADMPFAFGNLRMWDYPWRDVDWKVADAMTTYWTNVAKNLSPNGQGLVPWATYNPKDEAWMQLDATMRMEKFSSAKMDFLAAIQEVDRTRR